MHFKVRSKLLNVLFIIFETGFQIDSFIVWESLVIY